MKKKLTQNFIDGLPLSETRHDIYDDNCTGLFVRVGVKSKVFYLFYRGADGKPSTRKIGDAKVLTVAQAREMAIELKVKLIKGDNITKKKHNVNTMTLAELIDLYEPARIRSNKSGRTTIVMLRGAFKDVLNERVASLTTADIIKWCERRIDGGTKATTVEKNITAMRVCLEWGVDREYVRANVLSGFKMYKKLGLRKDSTQIVRYLSDAENDRLFAALDAREQELREARERYRQLHIKDGALPHHPPLDGAFADYLKPLVIVALFTGLRRGSLFSMQWPDVDFNAGVITLAPDKHKTGSKTSEALRLSVNDTALDTLRAWKACCSDKSPAAYVFASPRAGSRLDNIKKLWGEIMKASNIVDFRFHDLRHTFASRLAMNGVPLSAIAKAMGHVKINMTLRYAHLSEESIKGAVRTLDKVKRECEIIPIKEATA